MSPATVRRLRDAGQDVEWVGAWPKDPGDPNVLAAAHTARKVLVTIDRGFGALSVRDGQPHDGMIVIRKTDAIHHAALVLRVLELHSDDLARGAVIIATLERIRVVWPKPDA